MAEGTPDPQAQALEQALAKAGIRLECPSCGHEGWTTVEYPIHLTLADRGTEGVLTLALGCNRCGFIRLHAAQVLDQYMDPRDH